MDTQFHNLKVVYLERSIKDALSITLGVPPELRNLFTYHPGQHLVFRFEQEGEEIRRTYSLNSCPGIDLNLQVTVKRVSQGLISNYLNDQIKVGDALEVMPPTGRFLLESEPRNYRTIFLFAAGSGITPMYAILRSILNQEPYSNVCLLYGNKNKSSTIFKTELDELTQEYGERLQVIYIYSQPYSDWAAVKDWKLRKGIIDTETVERFISNHPPKAVETQYYICGPGSMNATVKSTLMNMGIEAERIHYEHFGQGGNAEAAPVEAVDNAKVKARLKGQEISVEIPKGKTILQALKADGHQPPFSCESGTCGTCVARVSKGTVGMRHCFALDDREIEQGLVLTCQGIPQSEVVELTFEP